ncbi:MAG: GntR family transcriptional regulator [Candidatus Adiutrix sp.]|jgi:DNA-binding GntR family transcriptional regulator|nr:GntR family transcriptional regulator [Candidatus Adiutrix sp.]
MARVRRLQDQAYDYLKEKIVSRELEEGRLYSEMKITRALSMSRTPVRDALLRLNMEGLIDIFPSRGFSVKKINQNELQETLEIRCALEGYAAYALAERIDVPTARETLFWLGESISDQEQLLLSAKPDVAGFVEHNFRFHNKMIDFLKNEAITQIYTRYEGKIKDMTYRHFAAHPDRLQQAFKGHVQIVALIRSGNTDQVFARVKNHNDWSQYFEA